MPIPDLDEGYLPPGIYDCTLDELKERFGGFQDSERRPRLFERLEQFVNNAKSTGLIVAILVNGSFVTAEPTPNDIDLILVLGPNHDFATELRPFEYNALSRREVRKRYGFDVLVAQQGELELAEYTEFFAQIRTRPGRRKGLLRVTP